MSKQRTNNKQFSILEEEQNLEEYYFAVEKKVVNNRIKITYLSYWINDVDRALNTIELFVGF